MPAQKRPLPPPSDHLGGSTDSPHLPPPLPSQQQHQPLPQADGAQPPQPNPPPELPKERDGDSDGEGGSQSSDDEADKDEIIPVKLADIRKEVQCPICLGIIRKTRTVMECLHRFCRECIDKSMRLGNNECPACRTHCASRRSLRDDPNYDALIAALYPDIDKYEEEELALHEEERTRNKKIQASIAETFRRQSEALGRKKSTKAAAEIFLRKSRGNFRAHGQNSYLRGRGRSGVRDNVLAGSDDDEEEEANGNDGSKDSSSAEDRSPDVRQKRFKRRRMPRSSPARTAGNIDGEENDDLEASRENLRTSPLRAGNREILAWGKNGTRSQTRHGNTSGSNGRLVKGGRMTKFAEHIRNLDETDAEFDVHLTLLPLVEQSMPNLERPYLCCSPTLCIRHLCQFIARQTSVQAEEVEIYIRKPKVGTLAINSTMGDNVESDPLEGLQIFEAQESLAKIHASFPAKQGELVLVYGFKMQR
ncbi:putative E3 ubiquitin-protein ligase RING1a [Phoenix dactylifera]|uniref:E3 ubiquitin-protein ligase RING1a n=1 Tax=Phoenix dactylifera TaxID=42345 RepID=A0A8B7C1I1_PHODC|nr:putative E3 ubiquitin-protein ligase RING1a [Phoenix dactylifera]